MHLIHFSSDDFCIETITSKDNTVHAIVNKKFLSRYQVNFTPTKIFNIGNVWIDASLTFVLRARTWFLVDRTSQGNPASLATNKQIGRRPANATRYLKFDIPWLLFFGGGGCVTSRDVLFVPRSIGTGCTDGSTGTRITVPTRHLPANQR